MKGKFIKTITVIDPDTENDIQISIFKLDNGAMIGVDESFLANTDEPVYSPYDPGVELDLDI